MMCRLLHSIPRGLRHKAQANATHSPWPGNGSQSSRQSEDNRQWGHGRATLSNDPHVSDTRSDDTGDSSSLVRQTHWKWNNGWRSLLGKSQWESNKGGEKSYTSQDALGWGTALAVGLHISRVLTAATLPDNSSGGRKKVPALYRPPGLWQGAVGALNLLGYQGVQGKRPKAIEPKHEAPSQESSGLSQLAAAVTQLHAVTGQYLGQACNSLGVKRAHWGDLEEAAGHFATGSSAGFSRATFNLAVCYEQGRGVAQDLVKAADLYRQASLQGHPQASYNLGVFHLRGTRGVQQDTALGLKLISTAAAAGVKQANRYLGIHFLENQEQRDEKEAVTYLQRAVDKQDTDAQYHLGLCYEHGWGVPPNSAKAASLYHSAAQKAHPEALYSLARFHELGLGGLPIDRESALSLYKEACEAGHQQAVVSVRDLESDPTPATSHAANDIDTASCKDIENPKALIPTGHRDSAVSNKALHLSSSAPDLTRDLRKGTNATITQSVNPRLASMKGRLSTSHLSLLLPHYLRLAWGPSATGGQRSNVTFQVGDDSEADGKDSGDVAAYCSVGSGGEAPSPWLVVS